MSQGSDAQPAPIFLGGQGGVIGPVRLGYGNVVAAGSILRHDYSRDNQLIFREGPCKQCERLHSGSLPRHRSRCGE